MFKRLALMLFALLPFSAYAQYATSTISGTNIVASGGAPLTGFITFRVNNCASRSATLISNTTAAYTGTTVPVTNGSFTLTTYAASSFCYQVGTYDAASGNTTFLTGFGAYAPAAGTVNFNGATTNNIQPDASVPAAYSYASNVPPVLNPGTGGGGLGTPGTPGRGFNVRGPWTANTTYSSVNNYDVFTNSGSTYAVTSSYTSGSTFGSTDTSNTALLLTGGSGSLPTDPVFNSVTVGGTGAGYVNYAQGAAPTSLPANTVQETVPSTVTSYRVVKAGAPSADTSGNTIKLYTLSGTTLQERWAAGCTVFACFGQANNFGTQNQSFGNGNLQLGQAGGSSTYSDFTFNGNHADGQRTGCVGATSDKSVYCDVPTGGFWAFRVNAAYIAQITGNGIQMMSLSGVRCNADNKGMLNYTSYAVGSNTADYLGICAKKADDTYAFRAVTLN